MYHLCVMELIFSQSNKMIRGTSKLIDLSKCTIELYLNISQIPLLEMIYKVLNDIHCCCLQIILKAHSGLRGGEMLFYPAVRTVPAWSVFFIPVLFTSAFYPHVFSTCSWELSSFTFFSSVLNQVVLPCSAHLALWVGHRSNWRATDQASSRTVVC